jgi:glycerophosphoryl diester phosphodiesterase
MAHYGKSLRSSLKLLLVIIVVQFIALAVVLLELTPSQGQALAADDEPIESIEAVPTPPLDDEDDALTDVDDTDTAEEEEPEPEPERTASEILADTGVISHGMGGIDEYTTLNCLEAFQQGYAEGIRVFEVDLRMTLDGHVVLRHDWRDGWQEGFGETNLPTLRQFLYTRILGKNTPLSFQDLLELMAQYPDICVITDTKFTDPDVVAFQFQAMLEDAQELDLEYVFNRMIVQVYSYNMFKNVDSLYHFPYYIYTLYNEGFEGTEEAFRSREAICQENGIMGLTMWYYYWDEAYAPIAQEYGITVYTHTVNDLDLAQQLLDTGVSAVYTDTITPADLGEVTAGEDGAAAETNETDEEGALSDGLDGEAADQ